MNNNFDIELLAPAKDKETAIEAINAGADAIYIGALAFGARKRAGNTLEDIKEIIDYAHKFYVKVFVTVNTILTDSELEEAAELIKKLYKINTDAIIIQDMGILKLAQEGKIPPIPLHISTQCNNRTKEKVKFFEALNIPRIVLARELSLEQIREIAEYSPNIELECFIHGALCVSYSGQCYLSQYIGSRSSNKGECAQPCRKRYSLCNKSGKVIIKNKYLLSLKDFNATTYLEEMIKAGVKSFKIEGRLKDKNYVKNVTLYYRGILDKYSKKISSGSIFSNGFMPDVNKTFNRGYTTYFLGGRENCFNFNTPKSTGEKLGEIKKSAKNYYIINTKQKINPQDGLCYFSSGGELKGFLVNKTNGEKIFPNKMEYISTGTIIYRNQDIEFEKRLSNIKITRKIACDIIIKDNILHITDEDYNKVILSLPAGIEAKNKQRARENFISGIKKTGCSEFYIKKLQIEQDVDFYQSAKLNEFRRKVLDKLMDERIKNYPKLKFCNLKTAKYPLNIGDYHENVYNKKAEAFYNDCACKINQYAPEKEMPVRQIELMRTKHCIKWAINRCQSKDELFLIDDRGEKYPLKFDCKNCEMAVLKPE